MLLLKHWAMTLGGYLINKPDNLAASVVDFYSGVDIMPTCFPYLVQ